MNARKVTIVNDDLTQEIGDHLSEAIDAAGDGGTHLLAALAATKDATFAAASQEPPGAAFVWAELLTDATHHPSRPTLVDVLKALSGSLEDRLEAAYKAGRFDN